MQICPNYRLISTFTLLIKIHIYAIMLAWSIFVALLGQFERH